jgi:histidinol-phosphate aminotransferase
MTYEYERVTAPAGGLRLHLNENTAGCAPLVLAALQGITRQQIALYPDYDDVVDAAAARLRVPKEQVILTNGLDEGILAASISSLRGSTAAAPFEALVIVPAFDMYAACVEVAGGHVVEVPLDDGFAFPLESVLAAIRPSTRVIFLTNPNNPTGQLIPKESLLAIAGAAPGALIFVDEAYGDFSGETLIGDPAFADLPNVVVGRTFSKAYGLAGLRVGALVGPATTLAALRRVVLPYTLSICAAVAVPAALADVGYYDWYLTQVRESKALLYATLDRLGLTYWPSAGNFVLARLGHRSRQIIDGLAARQVYVRDRSRDAGCADCVRVTAGTVEHTRLFIQALEEVLCDAV